MLEARIVNERLVVKTQYSYPMQGSIALKWPDYRSTMVVVSLDGDHCPDRANHAHESG